MDCGFDFNDTNSTSIQLENDFGEVSTYFWINIHNFSGFGREDKLSTKFNLALIILVLVTCFDIQFPI